MHNWNPAKGAAKKVRRKPDRQGTMSAGVDEGARRSGAKLVMEVEIEGLNSVGSDIKLRYRGLLTWA